MNNDELIDEEIMVDENKEDKDDKEIFFKDDNIETNEDKLSNKNITLIILGYICALIIPLIGLIYGIILIYIGKPKGYRDHGGYIITVAIVMCILYLISNLV